MEDEDHFRGITAGVHHRLAPPWEAAALQLLPAYHLAHVHFRNMRMEWGWLLHRGPAEMAFMPCISFIPVSWPLCPMFMPVSWHLCPMFMPVSWHLCPIFMPVSWHLCPFKVFSRRYSKVAFADKIDKTDGNNDSGECRHDARIVP